MTATEYVVLVDQFNQETGLAEKLEAHRQNLLHRAFSVFIFRNIAGHEPELLLQQRALDKYHSPGLWTNTCCSHPRHGENIIKAGERRLHEELGMIAELRDLGWFHYNAHFPNGLSENEIDHVLTGYIGDDNVFEPNPDEVHAIRWVTVDVLKKEIAEEPEKFTPWLHKALEIVEKNLG
jgi:isopentenyl-diphosphate delta-isomerase type 1